MTTLAEAEARVEKGDAAIRAREASGKAVPPAWYVAYDQAWRDLIETWEAEQRKPLVQHHRLAGVR